MNNNLIVFILFSGIISLSSCNDKYEKSELSSECSIDSTLISVPLDRLSRFSITHHFSQIQEIDGVTYLFGYDRSTNQLEWFNLTQKKEGKQLKLQKDGPNGFPFIYSFYAYSFDSIYVTSLNRLAIINSEGKVIYAKRINNVSANAEGINFEEYSIYNTPQNDSPIFYSKIKDKLFIFRMKLIIKLFKISNQCLYLIFFSFN